MSPMAIVPIRFFFSAWLASFIYFILSILSRSILPSCWSSHNQPLHLIIIFSLVIKYNITILSSILNIIIPTYKTPPQINYKITSNTSNPLQKQAIMISSTNSNSNSNKLNFITALMMASIMTISTEATCINNNCDTDYFDTINNNNNYLAAISIIGGRSSIQLSPMTMQESECPDDTNCDYYHDNSKSNSAVMNATHYYLQEADATTKSERAAATTDTVDVDAAVRFYPTWSQGQLCSSKSSSSFESWEESYTSLEECCDVSFSWDYDACMQSASS